MSTYDAELTILRGVLEDLPGNWLPRAATHSEYLQNKGCLLNWVGRERDRRLDDWKPTSELGTFLGQIAQEMFPDRVGEYGIVSTFNDHPDTTEADVLAVVEEAVRRLSPSA